FGDLGDQFLGHAGFYGNVHGGDGDSVPGRGKDHVHGFGVPPEIKFTAIFRDPILGDDGGDAAAHDDEFLREIGNLGIEADGLSDVRQRAAGVDGDFVRIFM